MNEVSLTWQQYLFFLEEEIVVVAAMPLVVVAVHIARGGGYCSSDWKEAEGGSYYCGCGVGGLDLELEE